MTLKKLSMQLPEFERTHSKKGSGLMIGVVIALVIVAGVVVYSIVSAI